MNRIIKLCLISAVSSYALRLAVDVLMFVFQMSGRGEIYDDFTYLVVPHFVAGILMVAFYLLFFREEFFSWFFRIFTVVLILANVALAVMIYFDSKIGYVWYFAFVAANNFLNALFLKCNIIPEHKDGNIEYYPFIFEAMQFVCMIISLYALFCGFPYIDTEVWIYYDLNLSFKLNIFCEAVLLLSYLLCMKNNAELIRDNMFDEEEFE